VAATNYQGAGAFELGGTSTFAVAGQVDISGADSAISIGGGAALTAADVYEASGGIYDAGLIAATGELVAGALVLDGGTLAAGTILVDGGITGHGVMASPRIVVSGTVEAQGGRLLLTGNVADGALVEVGAGATLEIGGTVGNAPVYFEGADAELVLDDATAGAFNVTQMQAGDGVDLVGIAPSLVSIGGGGSGYIFDSRGSVATQFSVQELGTLQSHISIVSDGAGGALLTIDGVLPCFARGTGILSPHGYRPVESLRPNDPVITANGERRPVRWIGWRTLDLGPDAARAARPVLIMPDAFGPGRPHKKLRLSPSHCIHTGGVLIPVTHLVNGATILRDTAAQAATYFHIELDRHDIVLAEGLECESYFDDGNRAAMYRELGRRCPARRMYAPVVTSGDRLAAVRRRLHGIALQAGFAACFQPSLRAVAAGRSAVPEILQAGEGRVAHFAFPAPVRELVLLSAIASPADTDPDSQDRRELGVCLAGMGGVRLGAGWHVRAAGDAGIWMGARAELALPRACADISLPLAAVAQSWRRRAQSWRRPVDAGRMGG
jgi:Hint domain